MSLPNTDGVKTNEFPPIKSDWYELIFEDFEEKTSKARNAYTKLTFKFANTNRQAWDNLSHGESSLWKVKQFKTAIGMKDNEGDLAPYKNTRLKGFCRDEEYEGKHYPRPQEYKSLDDLTNAPLPTDDDNPFV